MDANRGMRLALIVYAIGFERMALWAQAYLKCRDRKRSDVCRARKVVRGGQDTPERRATLSQ
jgi:hypothetical protein